MKRILAILLALAMCFALCACGDQPAGDDDDPTPPAEWTGVEDGVLTVGMECDYAPYNWVQLDNSNGAVPIKDSMLFANGYDVQMAKAICAEYGWQLEVVQLDWNSLEPAVMSKSIDAVIAGMSMTEERMEEVDFAGPYIYASIVCLTRKDSKFANAQGLADLAGGSCTSQISTIWYDNCLPQIPNANVLNAIEDAPQMVMAAATGAVDFVCTDMPTAQGAVMAYPELTILDFSQSSDNFEVSEGEINIGVALFKGNSYLKEKIDAYLSQFTADDFNEKMAYAISIQPISE